MVEIRLSVLLISFFGLNWYCNAVSYDISSYKTETGLIAEGNEFFASMGYKLSSVLDNTPIEQDVTFWCANRNNATFKQVYFNDDDIRSKLTPNTSTIFLIHGWTSFWQRQKKIGLEALKYFDVNVCFVDYQRLAMFQYNISSRAHAPKIANFVSRFINRLSIIEVSLNQVTIGGHSLGAHIAGFIGKNLQGLIGQIIGLDPAGPLFTFPILQNATNRLDSSDALYVQTIVTSKGQLGTSISLGHANFYPNGGNNPQPYCEVFTMLFGVNSPATIACSHSFSLELFKYSLNPANVFIARKCSSYMQYKLGLFDLNVVDVPGISSLRIAGDFYLQTTGVAPYVK